jgi:peptidoglycan/xylan/chitin deacetylase (PgdA/CDA1 family)
MTLNRQPCLPGIASGTVNNIDVLIGHEILIIKKLLHYLLTIKPGGRPVVQIAPRQRYVLELIGKRLAGGSFGAPGSSEAFDDQEPVREELKYRVLPLAAYLITYSPRIRSPEDKEFIRTHPGLLYKLWHKTPPLSAFQVAVPAAAETPAPARGPGAEITPPVPAGVYTYGPGQAGPHGSARETAADIPMPAPARAAVPETAAPAVTRGTPHNTLFTSFFRAFAVLLLVVFFVSYFMFAGVRINESVLSPERYALPETGAAADEGTSYTPHAGEITAGLYFREPGTDFQNRLTLTLDDIELNSNIDAILRTLRKYNIQAVFFIETGMLTDSGGRPYPRSREFLQKILLNGHTLGNHSYGHPNFAAMPRASSISANLTKAEEIIDEILGFHYDILYIRPPYGSRGRTRIVDKIVKQRNQLLILWEIDSQDWQMNLGYSDSRHLSARQVIDKTLYRIKHGTGGVILLHGFQHINLVLEPIIKRTLEFKNTRGGFRFVPIEELLEIKYRGK